VVDSSLQIQGLPTTKILTDVDLPLKVSLAWSVKQRKGKHRQVGSTRVFLKDIFLLKIIYIYIYFRSL